MKKVIQFKSVISGIDVLANILIGLIALAGVISMVQISPVSGLTFIVSAAVMWVFKVLAFGISYTLIQIAENTTPVTEGAQISKQAIGTDLEKQFCSLYEQNQESSKITDSMHRIYKKIQNGDKVKVIYLETAIQQLSA